VSGQFQAATAFGTPNVRWLGGCVIQNNFYFYNAFYFSLSVIK